MSKGVYKRRSIKSARMSTMPYVNFTSEGAKALNEWKSEYPKRMAKGRLLMLLSMADFVIHEVQMKAPVIDGYDYAKDLVVVGVEGTDMDAVAIVLKSTTRKLIKREAKDSILYLKPVEGSPRWVYVLMKYNPWPASLLPVGIAKSDAMVIRRKVSSGEIGKLSARIMSVSSTIESEMSRAGMPIKLERNDNVTVDNMHDDILFSIQRKEYGIKDGVAAHWRPALHALKGEFFNFQKRYVKYVQTGSLTAFNLPKTKGEVKIGELSKSSVFAKRVSKVLA